MHKLKRWQWIMIVGSFLILSLLGTAQGKDPTPPKKTPDLLNKGKKIFEQTCSPCHGSKGDGKGPAGDCSQAPSHELYTTPEELALYEGRPSKDF